MTTTQTITENHAARWWHLADNGKVVCTLCPRECHIPEGGRGFCFVRANDNDKLVLTTYGRSSGFCIDPIEKKPLNHFLPGTPVLSLGTAGCNLGCKFCQNWDISKSREMDTLATTGSPEAIVQAAKQSGSRSLAFTYNDPIIWAEYAIDIAKIARAEGIKTVAVTAGYISPDAREEFFQWMDAANVDLKAFTETFYRKLTQTHLQPVLDTLKYLKHETNVWFEITNLIIPGQNDSSEEIAQMCDWVLENLGDMVPIHFSAFHPDYKMKDIERTPPETLSRARQQAIDSGIKYAYVGNVHDPVADSTYCHNCSKRIIERDWYELGEYKMSGNRCTHCNTEIPGVFENTHGSWGRKRLPVRMDQNIVRVTTSASRTSTESSPPMNPSSSNTQIKIDFNETQSLQILDYARAAINAAVLQQPLQKELDQTIADAPAYGVFVTINRRVGMRACRGRWGSEQAATLGELLKQVAQDSARNDNRFARVCAEELERLAIDVSIMHNPQPVTTQGDSRIASIEVGKHGLVITHPRGQGLLLPHVATENNWDAKTFLDQLALKAGLPNDAWRDDAAQLMTFQTRLLTQPAPKREFDPSQLSPQRMHELLEALNRFANDQPHEAEYSAALTETHDEELGLYGLSASGLNTTAIGCGHNMIELAQIAATSFKDLMTSRGRRPEPINRLFILWQPVQLQADDYPNRHQLLTYNAVLARDSGRWALALPRANQQTDKVSEALSEARINPQHWRVNQTQGQDMPRVTAFNIHGFDTKNYQDSTGTRLPARAGQFYPSNPDEAGDELNKHFAAAEKVNAKTHRAVMLPHAGWRFCGDTIAKTLARTTVPDTVIILGPNHTGNGPAWSVTSHQSWELPGMNIPIATELVEKLVDAIPGLQCEPHAHRMEHGSEVLLPFLHRMNSNIKVVPIVVGRCTYEETSLLADGIAQAIKDTDTLLVISSDMNHFATEPENRRLDHMAIDAMLNNPGDPKKLYDTCTQNQISMCGMIPAVTIMRAIGCKNVELIDYCNSADATGDKTSVVGYAGMVLD